MSQANPVVDSAPDTSLGSVPIPMEGDIHLESQDLHVNKKCLKLGKGITAGFMLATLLGKVKCETGGLGWQRKGR